MDIDDGYWQETSADPLYTVPLFVVAHRYRELWQGLVTIEGVEVFSASFPVHSEPFEKGARAETARRFACALKDALELTARTNVDG